MIITPDDWHAIIKAMKTPSGFKAKVFAKKKGLKPKKLRAALILRFGESKLEFRRGRLGGVFFKKESNDLSRNQLQSTDPTSTGGPSGKL